MTLEDRGFLDIGAQRLEYRMIGPRPQDAPTLIMLHEGLGCVGMWDDFPDRLAAATGAGVFVYSRAGYGQSSLVQLPRPLNYLDDEVERVLPAVLDRIGFQRGLLIGHSDGASIAAQYAGSIQDHRIRGLVLIAPHFLVEDISIKSIAEARDAYANTDLKAKLGKWHVDPDNTFRGWNDAWLDPGFRSWNIVEELSYIRVPMLIVQGENDQYGTKRQIEVAQEECYCPVEVAMIPGARHTPQREAREVTLATIADFTNRLLQDHQEGALAAEIA